MHKGPKSFIFLGFRTDVGVNLTVAKFLAIIYALRTSINTVAQDFLVLPNYITFGLEHELDEQVVVLDSDGVEVDVIVDDLCT